MGRPRKPRPKPVDAQRFFFFEEEVADEKLEISDEQIELSFYYHFGWGYPDYIKYAANAIGLMEPHLVRTNPEGELTWKQLRQVLDAAERDDVKLLVASNVETSPSVLNYLSKVDGEALHERIAENNKTHRITLERLAMSSSSRVRTAVAENGHTPAATLEDLASDADPDVRYCIAENANMPVHILRRLEADENPYVSARAEITLQKIAGGEVIMVPFESRVRSTLTKIRALR